MIAGLDLTPPVGPRGRVWVAFSGGGDSVALLHLLRQRLGVIRAVHVHHGLQSAADDWVRHCRRVCRALGVPLRVLRVEVRPAREGPEAAARNARYAALAALLRGGDALATAHHLDDQAETVLFRALRGTGIAGLGAMSECEPLGAGRLWRPLLGVSREDLREHARRHGLEWIEDPHNVDPRYARAFLRQDVLPRLRTHFAAAPVSLARLARHAQAAERLLTALARSDVAAAARGDGLAIDVLRALDADRRRNLLYHRWRDLGAQPPAEAWYARVDTELLQARRDAVPVIRHGDVEARRYRDRLYLLRRLPPTPAAGLVLDWPARRRRLELPPGCGVLQCSRAPQAALSVRFAVPGARLQPAGQAHSRTLKNLCQERDVPPWVRARMPLIYAAGELVAVADLWRGTRAVDQGLAFRWVHELPGFGAVSPG